jgi:acyl-CoA synthetase (AMP-forming)/AMP-acid ligase II
LHELCSSDAASATVNCLWETCASAGGVFHAPKGSVAVRELAGGSTLGGKIELLRGRCVLLATYDQLPTALLLIELDGVARRLVLCTPDLDAAQLAEVAATAEADAIVVDAVTAQRELPAIEVFVASGFIAGGGPAFDALGAGVATPGAGVATPGAGVASPNGPERSATHATEWILLTSGTTGQPKLVVHSVMSLAGALPRQAPSGRRMVWSTFYDIRRYGGLQIYLRAVISGTELVLSNAAEPVHDFLARAAAAGVTHISGTPSHWRRALMSGDTGLINPEYVRLSGEVADQTVLDSLQTAFPQARIAHAFASTEAGVAFDVNDGLAGFPAKFVNEPNGAIDLKVQDGTLWIRSARTAAQYLGAAPVLAGADRYIDTGDMVELQGDRYFFRGRKGGIINVGGLKVHPEEVESVLNADPRVRMSLVKSKRNPITGAVIVADVVLKDAPADDGAADKLKEELLEACRMSLAKHKVPALLRLVPKLELTAAGKLVRPNA